MRTAHDYRAALARWRETAPANDSDILPRPTRTSKPRHRELAEQFKPVLVWRRLRSAAEADSVQTNWLADIHDELVAANDNKPLREDGYLDVWPSVDDLLDAVSGVEFEWRAGRLVPVGGDIERDAEGRLVRLGRLAISDTRPGQVLGLSVVGRDGVRRVVPATERFRFEREPDGPPPPLPGPPNPAEIRDARRVVQSLTDVLAKDDVATLDLALEAGNFADIGQAFGRVGKTAERFGKARLLAACAALQAALDGADTPLAA